VTERKRQIEKNIIKTKKKKDNRKNRQKKRKTKI